MDNGGQCTVSVMPEAAQAVLALAKEGASLDSASEEFTQALVALLIAHDTTELAMRIVGASRDEFRRAFLKLAAGQPVGELKLSLDAIRNRPQDLEVRLNQVTSDLSWLDRAQRLALERIPWRDELRGEIRLELMALGAGLLDGAAWMSGPVVHILLDLHLLENDADLVKVAAHEYNHAAVNLYRFDPARKITWLDDWPEPVRGILELLFMEGLARQSTLGRRYRDDIAACFAVVQTAINEAWHGRQAGDDLWTGQGGQGHYGGTAGAFVFETIFDLVPLGAAERALREGPLGVLDLYDSLAANRGLPRLTLRRM
ncbi:MAG: hypothetical protein Q8P31_05565 [Bacillota bacterium]|nr:hypothetical protein [Bacillota bacterium]